MVGQQHAPSQSTKVRALDHAVVVVRDLASACLAWERLGFTVSPAMQHEALGSSNRVVLFGRTYVELLGDIDRMVAPFGLPYQTRLALGDGLAEPCFKSDDLEADRRTLEVAGIEHSPIGSARRKVALPDGRWLTSASDFLAPIAPVGASFAPFLVRHRVPQAIFIPAFADHRNGASHIVGLSFLSRVPEQDARLLAAVTGATAKATSDGILVSSANAGIELLTPDGARRRYAPNAGEGADRGLGITIAVASLAKCEQALADTLERVRGDSALLVPPTRASGVFIEFIERAGVFNAG